MDSEYYNKPKLVENKIIKKIKNNNIVLFQNNIKEYLYNFFINNYKILLFIILISACLYWRYIETRKQKIHKLEYESDSEQSTSEDY